MQSQVQNMYCSFGGIHIGDPGSRPYMPHQHGLPLNEMDIKVEMENPYMDMAGLPIGATAGNMAGNMGNIANGGRLRKNKEDKICGVCGDRALGYNFDAISCESCKAFFRRNAPKGLEYFKCPYDEKCKMDISNRRFCKRCRLRKCFEIGMRKEYILTEEEKARKRQKIEENRKQRTTGYPPQPQCPSQQPIQPPHPVHIQDDLSVASQSDNSNDIETMIQEMERQGMNLSDTESVSSFTALSSEDQEQIDELHRAYSGSLDIRVANEPSRATASGMDDLANIAEVSVRRVIDMAKKIKTFRALPQADQISLLKGGSIELLILRSVMTFDKDKQHFLDPVDSEEKSAMKMEHFSKALNKMEYGETGPTLFVEHMKFVQALACDLNADNTMMILLLVLSLFSPDRPNLLNKELVSHEQEKYSMLLQKYLESKMTYQAAHSLLPRLLMKLTDIRNLNEEHSQVLLKVNPEGIQPLMQEVLDIRA